MTLKRSDITKAFKNEQRLPDGYFKRIKAPFPTRQIVLESSATLEGIQKSNLVGTGKIPEGQRPGLECSQSKEPT